MAYYSGEHDKDISFRITIGKLDAAHSQITSAIFLYFHLGDPIALHTLVAAAYGVIQDINKHQGGEPMTQDFDFIEDKKIRKEIVAAFHEPQNFFKHANRDPEGAIEFLPYTSTYMLFESVIFFQKLAKHKSPLFEMYKAWFVITGFGNESDPFSFPPEYRKFLSELRSKYKVEDRLKYFVEEMRRRCGNEITLSDIFGTLRSIEMKNE